MENKFLVRGECVNSRKFIQGYYFDKPLLYGSNSLIYLEDAKDEECEDTGWTDIDRRTIGKFTGLTDDSEVTLDEPRNIFEGDILELQYEGDVFNCVVAWEICGFLLGSEYFEDSYIWLTEVMESENNYHWIGGAKLIGNKYDNPGLLLK